MTVWELDGAVPRPGEPCEVAPGLWMLLAPNANSWTFEGTNTWVLADGGEAVVVDPGPDDRDHLDAIDEIVAAAGAMVRDVIVSHHHGDHAAGALPLAGRWAATVHPAVPRGDVGEGARFDVGSLRIGALPTPGHTADGVSLVLPDLRMVLTGDTVLARVNPFISHPDGTLSDMLASMRRLLDVVDDDWVLLPGHGPAIRDPRRHLQERIAGRLRRVAEVATHLASGVPPDQITRAVYPRLDPTRLLAAQASVNAIVQYLDDHELDPIMSRKAY